MNKSLSILILLLGLNANISFAQTATELYKQGVDLREKETSLTQQEDNNQTSMANTLAEKNKTTENNVNNQNKPPKASIKNRYIYGNKRNDFQQRNNQPQAFYIRNQANPNEQYR